MNFLLKCHALSPIFLTFLVVHFYMHIYVSILNLWFLSYRSKIFICYRQLYGLHSVNRMIAQKLRPSRSKMRKNSSRNKKTQADLNFLAMDPKFLFVVDNFTAYNL